MTKLRIPCPAKVNLFLAVGPPDRRGYHPLRTVFQAVALYDFLDVEFGGPPTWKVEVDGAELPAENTVSKALRLSQEVFAVAPSRVRLEKHIPMQSGLGGGSSDAAGLLRALDHIRPGSPEEMRSLAAAVGADVPFFLAGGRAKGEGYGDQITPLPDAPEEWYVIAKPPIGCSTPEMYARLDEKPREWRDWPEGDELCNDFERVAPCECLDLTERLRILGARDAALSGSGSSVFGRFADEGAATAAAASMKSEGHAQVWVAKGLSRRESLRIDRL
ncbi:MAG TPA: 4-(cytidine 5'-diphospho)-2-C-methyl-D-erythritol kinase [Fimbriimonadaceae bacterium]|nr:4-(cytidine 5'-diphospho)-2-C-methyl-D-erythritol kinase [Fimbriimonadaceae bacterium]